MQRRSRPSRVILLVGHGLMMTAMALTREIERGTMENLLAMPVPRRGDAGQGPALFRGRQRAGACRAWRCPSWCFRLPFLGSLPLLLAGVGLFVMALVILGYLISTVARTQMQAMQLTFFYFLPSLLLSGFMFPFRGMPAWAQALGEILPLTHFLRFIRAIMLRRADLLTVASTLRYWLSSS